MKDIIEKLGITPGPWYICNHSWSDTSIYSDKDGKHICTHSISDDVSENTQEEWEKIESANFKLIAASLEMLKDWINTALKIEDYNNGSFTKNMLLDFIFNDAVKNIKKATGKTWSEIKELL